MTEYLSQDIDLLDFLRTKLGDLSGFATLANELIQNAEDAKASEIIFDVTDNSNLVIKNDSQFSEDDFERMRRIAGGDRRADEWTIGKFGIGFTSIYLITDSPQLISSGKHWIFRPQETADKRIEQKRVASGTGTCFILPWSTNNSIIRQKLKLLPITRKSITQFIEEVQEALPKALLFLKNLKKITLKTSNNSITVSKINDNERTSIRISEEINGEITREEYGWYLIEGNFNQNATLLRNKYGDQNIPQNRKANVTVAIPDREQNIKGLFYAFLPTQEKTNLPFHINADFFPSSDRKRIPLDNDYRGTWNKEAWKTAIFVFANNLDYLKDKLGHRYLWKIIDQCKTKPDFWQGIISKLRDSSLIWTTNNQWRKPKEVFLLKEFQQERNAIPVLQEMGLSIVHENLNSYSSLLSNTDIGVPFLDASSLANFLIQSGLNRQKTMEEAPQWIQTENNRNLLGMELAILLKRKQFSYQLAQIKSQVAQCAIALGHDGKLYPINNLYPITQQVTLQLFIDLSASVVFLASNSPSSIKKIIEDYKLTKAFTAEAVITALENIPIPTLKAKLQQPNLNLLPRLFQWLEDRENYFTQESIKIRLCKLPIFPSGNELVPLTGLLVPGSFNDPLHLASLVDLEAIGGHREFLMKLGAKELTLLEYVRYQIPLALK